MTDKVKGSGTADDPWVLRTPPGTSEFSMHRDDIGGSAGARLPSRVDEAALPRSLPRRCAEDAEEARRLDGSRQRRREQAAKDGTLEAWARSPENPVKGWYGLRKGYRGRFAMYVPPLLEHLGLVELEHNAKNNRVRAR